MPANTNKDGTTHYLPATTRRRLQPPVLSVVAERMLRHAIYQLPLEGGYYPLVLLVATERMLLHLIYQLLLEGDYNLLADM